MSVVYHLPSPSGRARRCFVCLAILAIIAVAICTNFFSTKGKDNGTVIVATAAPGSERATAATPGKFQDNQSTPMQLTTKQETVPSTLDETAAPDISSLIPEELTMQEIAPPILEPIHDLSQRPLNGTRNGTGDK